MTSPLFYNYVFAYQCTPPSRGHLAITGYIFGCQAWGTGRVLLASGKQRPGMLLNILQCIGQPPQQRTIQSKISTVPRLRDPALKIGNSLKIGIISVSSQYPSANSVNVHWLNKCMKKMNKSIQIATQTISHMSPPLSFPSTWGIFDRGQSLSNHSLNTHCLRAFHHSFNMFVRSYYVPGPPHVKGGVRTDGQNLRTGPKDAVCY